MNKFLLLSFLSFKVLSVDIQLPKNFLFGLANAPGHVEDQLSDIWLDFAENKNGVFAYHNQYKPEERLHFWSDYKTEIDLAAKANIQIFRMGIDWGRLTQYSYTLACLKKKNCLTKLDQDALQRYKEIIDYIRSKNLKVMLTLFHHSLPLWATQIGGFTNKYTSDLFIDFSQQIFHHFQNKVDYWITFNEPAVYASLTHAVGLWPSGFKKKAGATAILNLGPIKGRSIKVQNNMIKAHKAIYQYMHQQQANVKVSIAKNIGHYVGDNIINKTFATFAKNNFNFYFLKKIINHIDYIGLNYYGAEHVKGLGIEINKDREYSEAGRTVSPLGMYKVIKEIEVKFNKKKLPYFITENGIADETDILRPSYLVEHLAVINKLIKEGLPFIGYIFWTLTDNWEWADGYCPKFGLVAVDRQNEFKRIPRDSYFIYADIAKNKFIGKEDRKKFWDLVQKNVERERPFCRSYDGQTPLDTPSLRKFSTHDWRFKIK